MCNAGSLHTLAFASRLSCSFLGTIIGLKTQQHYRLVYASIAYIIKTVLYYKSITDL